MTFSGRVGQFLLILGIALLVIFVISDLAEDPQFNLFFWGLGIAALGIIMMRRGRLPAEPSGRFRILQNYRNRGKGKKRQEETSNRPVED